MATDLNNLMKEAQKMQKRMQEAQADLINLNVTAEAGGGLAKATMNGRHELLKLSLNANLADEDMEMIEDLVVAAVNAAVQKIEVESKKKIAALTAGLNIPTDLTPPADDDE